MLQKYRRPKNIKLLLQFFFALIVSYTAQAQLYNHNFGTTTINTHPYTVPPSVIDANLSGSSWQNSTGSWTSNTGATGQAITLFNSPGTTTVTLTLTIAPSFVATITSFNFWRQRSNSGPQNWQMSINGIEAGNGTIPTAGSAIGVTPVANPVTGLTGNITVILTMTGAAGNGNMRLDDFTLNGNVVSNCNSVEIDSFSPQTGPENTLITITGSGFNSATSVKFDDIEAVFVPVSDTEIAALVPEGATDDSTIIVAGSDGCGAQAIEPFSLLTSDCEGTAEELYISELYDHTPGSYGMIELYNPTDETITFNGQYTLERAGDIGGSASYSLVLPGSIGPGMTYLVRSFGTGDIGCGITADANMGQGINANDEFKLFKNGSLIDIARAPSFIGYTVIRTPDAVAPSPTYNSADWTNSSNNCSNLGIHDAVPTALPVPDISGPNVQAACENGTATFTVSLPDPDEYTYQWKVLNSAGVWVDVNNGGNYSGTATSTLTISDIPADFNNNQYYCEITSATCNLVSDAAQLYINPLPQTPEVSASQPDCSTATGTATVTAPTAPGLTYSIDGINYSANNEFEGLEPDTYTITVRNIEGCTSEPATVIINDPTGAPEEPEIAITQPTCTEASGTITITAPTGTGLQYSIGGNYQDETVFENLSPGDYDVTVQDAGGCISGTITVTIDDAPQAPDAADFTVSQPDCDMPTGTIQITSPLGNGFQYSINGTDYTYAIIFNNLLPDSYPLTVQDSDGCISDVVTVVINPAPDAPAIPEISVVQPDCNTATGSLEVTSPIGTSFTYSIDGDNYQASPLFDELPPDSYTITVHNAQGCIAVSSAETINSPPTAPDIPEVTVTQPDCDTSTGIIEITSPLSNGNTYSINEQDYQASPIFNNLIPDDYMITVQNAEGCISESVQVTINTAPLQPGTPQFNVSQPNCITITGTIEVTSPTGTGLLYSIDGNNYQATPIFNGLDPDTYTITVQNADGCISSLVVQEINAVPNAPEDAVVSTTQPDCNTATGSIEITSPITGGLTYSIDGENYQASTIFNGLPSDVYSVTVQGAPGCISQAVQVTINNAPATPNSPQITAVQPACTTNAGSITVTSPIGNGLLYSIDGINYQPENTFNNLLPDSYTVTVQNQAGCISAPIVQVINTIPNAPAAPTLNVSQPDCTTATGSITVTAPTGQGITYSINGVDYENSPVFDDLSPGNYTITVQNAQGCISPASQATINQAPAIPNTPQVTAVQPDCNTITGTITITAPTGNGLLYSIDGVNYQQGTVFNDVTAETYTVTVQNAQGCTSPGTEQVINNAPAIPDVPTVSVLQPDCDTATGTIEITSPAGNGFIYSIDNGVTYQPETVFENIPPGSYTITLQNNSGCTNESLPIVIDAPPAPAPNPGMITGIAELCVNGSSQFINNEPGGTWSVSNSTIAEISDSGILTAIASGIVTVRYTVGSICTAFTEISVTINPLPAPAMGAIYYICRDAETGDVSSVTLDSGISNQGHSFTWSKNGTLLPDAGTNSITVNEPGEYSVVVTNTATGCIGSASGTVIVSSPALATAEVRYDFNYNQTIVVTVTGGSGDYEYSLTGGPFQDIPYFTGIYEGEYTITVRDKNGCGVTELTVFALNYPRFFTPNGDGENDTWNISGLRNQPDSFIYIFDRYGKLIATIRPSGLGWDGTYNGERLPATDYWFKVLYRSSVGTDKEFNAHFSLLR